MDRPEITIKAISIDDEPIALSIIQRHAAATPNINVVQSFLSGSEAIAYLKKERVDLIFLDITMPDMTGVEFARQIDPSILIVFTTAHPEYAVTGFDLAATDYLLKPISLERFTLAVERAIERISKPTVSSSLFVKDGYSLVQINVHELLYVESEGNYVTFFKKSKKTVSRMKLTDASQKLPARQFLRIHKCFLVNKEKIDRIDGNSIVISNKRLPVSTRYRKDLIRGIAG